MAAALLTGGRVPDEASCGVTSCSAAGPRVVGHRPARWQAPASLPGAPAPVSGGAAIEEPTPASGSYSGQVTLQEALRRRVGTTWQMLLKELSAFGVVGAVAFVLDVGLFQALYAGAGIDAVPAKLVSTLVAMTFAYVGHRHWSFSHRARTGLRREYLLFALVNGVTLLLGLTVVWVVSGPLGQTSALVLQVANVGSIAVGTVIRFLSYRRWVFPAAAPPASRGNPRTSVHAPDGVPAGSSVTSFPGVPGASVRPGTEARAG